MQENELKELRLKEDLISLLLNAKFENNQANEYFRLIQNDFISFANQESSLKEEAQAILKLQEIGKELNLVASEPEFYSKKTIAIAGGFSAGKSEFISSFFNIDTLHLPSGIQPTTAIPTYVMDSKDLSISINAFNHKGAKVDLLKISPDFYTNLSHKFLQSFKFNLRDIMPNVFISLPMKFKNLCFIDTPGYNPSETHMGFTGEDIYVAKNYSKSADILIWLIGLDANGTIPKTDLDFLTQLSENDKKKIYVVLNKADLRPKSSIEDVLDTVEDTLIDYDIEVEGISAYSSILKTEIAYRKTALFDFLESVNTRVNKHHQILHKLFEVDRMYQVAILTKIKEFQYIRKLLDKGDWSGKEIVRRQLRRHLSVYNTRKQFELLEEVILKLEKAINNVFHIQENSSRRKVLALEDVNYVPYFKDDEEDTNKQKSHSLKSISEMEKYETFSKLSKVLNPFFPWG